jgi:hypothetical protein
MKVRPKYFQPEAFKVDIGFALEAQAWVRNRGGVASYVDNKSDGDYLLVTNGQSPELYTNIKGYRAYDGDWIIRHQSGFLVNSPEQFRANWEPA